MASACHNIDILICHNPCLCLSRQCDQGSQMPLSPQHEHIKLCSKTLSWAYLNFEVQMILYHWKGDVTAELEDKLRIIGCGEDTLHDLTLQGKESFFLDDAFFSSFNTGKRIISFALKENGLNQQKLQEIEESILHAYENIKEEFGDNTLLEMSYRHTLQTLSIFRL